jgi:hypothetical protein
MRQEKPIRLSSHARTRARERGATEEEIRQTILKGVWEAAKRGNWQVAHRLSGGGRSPFDGMRYNEKTLEVILADEPDEIVVVTVKVFYRDREEPDEDRV